jgi:hypothetical protein
MTGEFEGVTEQIGEDLTVATCPIAIIRNQQVRMNEVGAVSNRKDWYRRRIGSPITIRGTSRATDVDLSQHHRINCEFYITVQCGC